MCCGREQTRRVYCVGVREYMYMAWSQELIGDNSLSCAFTASLEASGIIESVGGDDEGDEQDETVASSTQPPREISQGVVAKRQVWQRAAFHPLPTNDDVVTLSAASFSDFPCALWYVRMPMGSGACVYGSQLTRRVMAGVCCGVFVYLHARRVCLVCSNTTDWIELPPVRAQLYTSATTMDVMGMWAGSTDPGVHAHSDASGN